MVVRDVARAMTGDVFQNGEKITDGGGWRRKEFKTEKGIIIGTEIMGRYRPADLLQ
jgi:hypothetical protein